MKSLLTIFFLLFIHYISGQKNLGVCECLKKPIECIPELSKREIVNSDTFFAHHSYCYEVLSSDKNHLAVVSTFFCDKKPTDPFLLSFFDSTTLGTRNEIWYDTSGRPIYCTLSQNNVVKECYWYHCLPNKKNYDFIVGYRNGERFKELYEWDEYGALWKKKIIITAKEITTVVFTHERDQYGNYIQKVSTIPNKTGKIE